METSDLVNIASIGSFIIALISLFWSRKNSKKIKELQIKVTTIEKNKITGPVAASVSGDGKQYIFGNASAVQNIVPNK